MPKARCWLVILFLWGRGSEPALTEQVAVKVLTVAMFEIGEMRGDTPGEDQLWIERQDLQPKFDVPGAGSPLYCSDRGHCLVVTQMGIANTAATMMAIWLDRRIDLTLAYVLVAGIAGAPPSQASIGSAA